MVYFLTVLCLALALCVQGFAGVRTQPRTFFHFSTGTHVLRSSSVTALKAMSLDEIREKIKNTPGYNPMQDPEAMKTLEENIPQELREVNGALQRMQVAFKDATSGVDKVEDLDGAAANTDKKTLISSPSSQWFQQGTPDDNPPFSQSVADDLKDQLAKKFPGVPN